MSKKKILIIAGCATIVVIGGTVAYLVYRHKKKKKPAKLKYIPIEKTDISENVPEEISGEKPEPEPEEVPRYSLNGIVYETEDEYCDAVEVEYKEELKNDRIAERDENNKKVEEAMNTSKPGTVRDKIFWTYEGSVADWDETLDKVFDGRKEKIALLMMDECEDDPTQWGKIRFTSGTTLTPDIWDEIKSFLPKFEGPLDDLPYFGTKHMAQFERDGKEYLIELEFTMAPYWVRASEYVNYSFKNYEYYRCDNPNSCDPIGAIDARPTQSWFPVPYRYYDWEVVELEWFFSPNNDTECLLSSYMDFREYAEDHLIRTYGDEVADKIIGCGFNPQRKGTGVLPVEWCNMYQADDNGYNMRFCRDWKRFRDIRFINTTTPEELNESTY